MQGVPQVICCTKTLPYPLLRNEPSLFQKRRVSLLPSRRYKPQTIEVEAKLKPFIPDYIPSVGGEPKYAWRKQHWVTAPVVNAYCV
jgi:hypothetical protein